jgi:hypothetical protein
MYIPIFSLLYNRISAIWHPAKPINPRTRPINSAARVRFWLPGREHTVRRTRAPPRSAFLAPSGPDLMATATHHSDAPGLNGAEGMEMMAEANELRRRGKPSDDRTASYGAGAEEDEAAAAAAPSSSSVERAFADQPVPSWREQLTLRAFVVSFFLAVMFSVIVMKLNLTTGIIPSLNISAGLLGFFFVRLWTKAIESVGLLRQPFTRQENTVIQTCVVASYGLSFSGNNRAVSHLYHQQISHFLRVFCMR